MADEARSFQWSSQFATYGWSQRGPFNQWLVRFREVRSTAPKQANLSFLHKYEFTLTDVYQVATAILIEGQLDSYYRDIDTKIQNVSRCEY